MHASPPQSLLICAWVAQNFKTGKFPFVWPIKLARVFVGFFFSTFYLTSLRQAQRFGQRMPHRRRRGTAPPDRAPAFSAVCLSWLWPATFSTTSRKGSPAPP